MLFKTKTTKRHKLNTTFANNANRRKSKMSDKWIGEQEKNVSVV